MGTANKTNITKRSDKSNALTHPELDQNFSELENVIDDSVNLENGKVSKGEVGSEQVDSATGTQSIPDALDQRVIYVDTIADLQALPTGGLVEGQEASIHGSAFTWDGSQWNPEGAVNIRAFDIQGDGTTDDSVKVQTAVDTGYDLFIPDTGPGIFMATAVDINTAGQKILGAGRENSKFVSAGTEPCFRLKAEGSVIESCVFKGEGTQATSVGATNGALVRVLADNCSVRFNKFDSYRYGVEARACNNPDIVFNRFVNGLTASTDDHTETGIAVDYRIDDDDTAEGGCVSRNYIDGGFGIGISLYAEDSTSTGAFKSGTSTGRISGVSVDYNQILNGFQYGILLYRRGGSATLDVTKCDVSHNIVDNITGDTLNANSSTRIYGTGIYLQGAEDNTVAFNIVSRCCKATDDDLLVPSGIGITNAVTGKFIGNTVFQIGTQGGSTATAGGIGMRVKNTNTSTTNAVNGFGRDPLVNSIVFINNEVDDTLFENYYARDCINFSLTGSVGKSAGTDSVVVDRSGDGDFASDFSFTIDPEISGCRFLDPARYGVFLIETQGHSVIGNKLRRTGDDSIRLNSCGYGSTQGNDISGQSNRAIVLLSSNDVDQNVSNNTLNGGSQPQIFSFIQAKIEGNVHSNPSTAIRYDSGSTSNTGWWDVADGDTTPAVNWSQQIRLNNSGATTVTAFDDVPDGHEFSVLITDSNTTIQFSGESLSGNGGADLSASSGTLILCRKRASVVYCLVS